MKIFAKVLVCVLALSILTASLAGCGKKEPKDAKAPATAPAK
jgi:hypothetical protein